MSDDSIKANPSLLLPRLEAENTGVEVRATDWAGNDRGGTEEGKLARKRKARKTEAQS